MSAAADVSVEAQINRLIKERLNVVVTSPEVDLIDSGVLDSIALVMLISSLEDEFHCELPLDDFDPENFRTISRIATFMEISGVPRSERTA